MPSKTNLVTLPGTTHSALVDYCLNTRVTMGSVVAHAVSKFLCDNATKVPQDLDQPETTFLERHPFITQYAEPDSVRPDSRSEVHVRKHREAVGKQTAESKKIGYLNYLIYAHPLTKDTLPRYTIYTAPTLRNRPEPFNNEAHIPATMRKGEAYQPTTLGGADTGLITHRYRLLSSKDRYKSNRTVNEMGFGESRIPVPSPHALNGMLFGTLTQDQVLTRMSTELEAARTEVWEAQKRLDAAHQEVEQIREFEVKQNRGWVSSEESIAVQDAKQRVRNRTRDFEAAQADVDRITASQQQRMRDGGVGDTLRHIYSTDSKLPAAFWMTQYALKASDLATLWTTHCLLLKWFQRGEAPLLLEMTRDFIAAARKNALAYDDYLKEYERLRNEVIAACVGRISSPHEVAGTEVPKRFLLVSLISAHDRYMANDYAHIEEVKGGVYMPFDHGNYVCL